MKIYILIACLWVILLSDCSMKNDTRNNLHKNQMCYYQDNNLLDNEQIFALSETQEICSIENESDTALQGNISKDIGEGLQFLQFLHFLFDIGNIIGAIFF